MVFTVVVIDTLVVVVIVAGEIPLSVIYLITALGLRRRSSYSTVKSGK